MTGRLKASREELRHLTASSAMLQYIKQRYLDKNVDSEKGKDIASFLARILGNFLREASDIAAEL